MPFVVGGLMNNINRFKSQKGITLVALVITVIIMIILTFTITLNISQYDGQKTKSNFENDINSLNEEIAQYYSRTKTLPIINKYTNITMLTGIKNVNDGENYYVIDVRQLEVSLNLGSDYNTALSRPRNTEIADLTDIYIINEQSHTIYYPKGVYYNGSITYMIPETYSNVIGEQTI